MKSKIRACLDHFEVQLVTADNSCLGIMIPLEDIISNLIRNNPVLLQSFLIETITNRYSQDTHNFVVDYVDYQLPGEAKHFWRPTLYGELPRLRYLQTKAELFRGPVYRCHRFIAGSYFHVVFSMNHIDDLRIELESPNDGNFTEHKYLGKTITVDLSRDTLRAFVAKLCMDEKVVPRAHYQSLDMLHPDYWIDFFPLLLDFLIIDVQHALKESYKREKKNDIAYRVVPGSNLQKLQEQSEYLMLRFVKSVNFGGV